jgi:hypothetical protein
MKKVLLMSLMLMLSLVYASAQKEAEIKFEKTTYDFGTFSESTPVQKCTFTFTNVGEAPLIIHQAIASCGCTVPQYTKKPIAPGEKGTLSVTYNGKGRFPGHFKKSITIRTNGKPEMLRLYIEGTMEEAK